MRALFTDASWYQDLFEADVNWSIGASTEFMPGIQITTRYFDDKHLTIGLAVDFGHVSLLSNTNPGREAALTNSSFGISCSNIK